MSTKITAKNTSTDWLEQMGASIALLDHKFQFVAGTNNWFQSFNLDRKESKLLGKSIFSIFPYRSDDLKTRLEYALDGLKDIQIMFRGDKMNTNVRDSIWYLNPWKDGYGNTIGVVINVKEVSERKNIELALNKTKFLLNQKSEIAQIGSWEYSVVDEKLFWSEKVRNIHGVPNDFLVGAKDILSFYKQGASFMTMKRAIERAINNAKPWNETVQVITHEGKQKWVNCIGRPKFKDGQCSRILGTIQELEKFDENKIRTPKSNTLDFQHLFEQSEIPMACCELESGNIIISNKALHNTLGVNAKDLWGKPFENYLSIDKTTRFRLIKSLLKRRYFDSVKATFVQSNRTPMIVEVSGKLFSDKTGRKIISVVVKRPSKVYLDRSDSQALDADQEIEKLVTFNHMIAHNLKAHATNISLLLGFVDKENNVKERNNMMRLLSQSTDYLMNEIKSLRDMVAIGESKGLKKVSLPLNDFIFGVEHKLSGLIKKEGVKIFNGVEDSLKVHVVPVYLESIINNLLSNSIKFKQKDKNPVIVFNAFESSEHIILSIEDNGVGIDLKRHKDKIFGLYKTVNTGKSSGMGLYLAQYQMELMKGKIHVESKVGVGTTFKLYIPKKLEGKNYFSTTSPEGYFANRPLPRS